MFAFHISRCNVLCRYRLSSAVIACDISKLMTFSHCASLSLSQCHIWFDPDICCIVAEGLDLDECEKAARWARKRCNGALQVSLHTRNLRVATIPQ